MLLVTLGTLASSSASAEQGDAPPIAYYASSDCPTRSEFVEEIGEQAKVAMTPANPRLPPYIVEVGQNDQGAFAILQYRDASGNSVERTFRAASCYEVASAVALVIALALRGDETLEPVPSMIEQREQPSKGFNNAQQEQADRTKKPVDESEEKGAGIFDWQIGANVVVDSLTTPGLLIKAGVFGGVVWNDEGSGVQAGFVFGDSGVVQRNDRRASFLFLGGRIDVCPLHILQMSGFVVHPCLALEMGSIRSKGDENELFRSETHEKFWSAGGPLLRVSTTIYELMIELHGGVWFPLVRGTEEYVYSELEGETSFYDIPIIGGTSGANFGYRF